MIPAIRAAAPVRPLTPVTVVEATPPAAPVKPAKPVVAQAPAAQPWTLGRVTKAVGTGAAGFAGGAVGTFVVDLFFHFGNNGGTAWPGGIYLAAAGLVAAGAVALYARASAH